MATCNLKKIPEYIYNFLVDIQGEIKKKRQINVFSLESTIYKVLNDSRKCVEETHKKELDTEISPEEFIKQKAKKKRKPRKNRIQPPV